MGGAAIEHRLIWTTRQIANSVKKLPKCPKIADASKNRRNEVDRASMGKIITLLAAHPDRILPTLGLIEQEQMQQAGKSVEKNCWEAQTKTLRQIPDYWWAMIDNSAGGLSKGLLHKVMDHCSDGFSRLVAFAL